jgi:hypothetical protein
MRRQTRKKPETTGNDADGRANGRAGFEAVKRRGIAGAEIGHSEG